MNSNGIIDEANKFIAKLRKGRGIDAFGHFAYKYNIEKKLGCFKKFIIELYFIDNEKKPHFLVGYEDTRSCLSESDKIEVEEFLDRQLLRGLFCCLTDTEFLESIVTGNKFIYGNK